MEAYYFELRALHIGAVIASGALFTVRALAVNLAGARWPLTRPVRMFSYAVDGLLLVAAVLLTTVIRQYPFVNAWLTAKLVLLVVYILLGYAALRGHTRARRLACLVAALGTYGFIVTVARAHDPLGFLTGLLVS
jgi:uncharacterized membrane protein SirB2